VLEEAAGGLLGGGVRLLGWFLVEVVHEVMVRGMGYTLLRGLGARTRPQSALCVVVGLGFWLLCFGVIVAIWRFTR
jgi:hypothetical protein